MTAAWVDPAPSGTPGLRLVGPVPDEATGGPDGRDRALVLVPGVRPRSHRRPVPTEVRRRRTLLAVIGLLLAVLALPLSGTGGHSHATGSAPAGNGSPVVVTVRPGDSLWSIAERVDPAADPRPLVARLAAVTGSENVVPGERITLP